MKNIIKLTTFWVLACYIIVGVLGYLTFADGLNSPTNIAKANGIVLLAFQYTPEGAYQPLPILIIVVNKLFLLYHKGIVLYNNDCYDHS